MEITQYAELNKGQLAAERDPFTYKRYVQFYRYFDSADRAVLDIGCNTGRGGQILKEVNPQLQITGLDVVPERLDKIPGGLYERLILSSADDIDVPDNTFDDIVAGEVIEHIDPADVQNVLTELLRVLKPGGRVMLTTPNPKAFLVLMGRDAVLKDPSHICIMRPGELKKRLQDAGFDRIRIKGSGKMSNYLPDYFPIMGVFGSYLAIAHKPGR